MKRNAHANSKSLPLYKAVVTSAGDKEHPGRIQIRVQPQFRNVDKDLLPWADPLVGAGMGTDEFEFHPPQVDSLVWCVFLDDYWKSPRWLPGQFISGFFDYDGKVKPALDAASDVQDSEYPNVRFTHLPTGNIEFHNVDNGEYGFIHNSGSYNIFDPDGNMYFYTVGEAHTYNDNGNVRLAANGEIELNGNTDYAVRYSELLSAFNQLKEDLNALINAYNSHVHTGGTISGSTGTISTPPGTISAADVSGSKVDNVRLP